jgi:acetylornithine deacetylase/succinyl-diaminopimelate desuccinylase-like protein
LSPRWAARVLATAVAATALVAVTAAAPAATPSAAPSAADAASNALARAMLKELVEIDTTDPAGNVTAAAQAMAKRFRDAGFAAADVQVLGPDNPRKQNLVVRLHGSGAHRPVLLIGHLDVVAARREDWRTDPFRLVEKDGFYYGRGTQDMKDDDAIMAAALMRLRHEGFRPSRDIILALTADEESGCCNGVDWLLKNRRALVDAEFVVNGDDLTLVSEHGVPREFRLTASEKLYADYELTVTNKGGHSSVPRADNAINQMAAALTRVAAYRFPVELNPVTRAYFERQVEAGGPQAGEIRAALATPADPQALARLSAEPDYNALLRTTCVATRIAGGDANNALPQRVRAIVNCRILPGHSQEEIRQKVIAILADPAIAVRYVADDGTVLEHGSERRALPPPPLLPQLLEPLKRVLGEMWPGVPIIPAMSVGASDGIYTEAAGMPTYCVMGVAVDRDDDREHGNDERIGVAAFDTGNEFFYRFLRALTAP